MPETDSPSLFIHALQAYSRAASVAVTFKRNHEIFTLNGREVRCRYLSDQSAPLDPRLLFPLAEGIAYITLDTLQLLGDTGEFRLQDIHKDGSLAIAMRNLSWDEMVGEVAAKLGPDAVTSQPAGSVREILAAFGACTPEALDRAEKSRRRDESLGSALVRMGIIGLEELLETLVGPPFLYRPPHHGPLAIGKTLRQAGKITAEALAEAIAAEAQQGKPLRQSLIESRACHFADLESVQIPEIKLPPADQAGEILIRQGLMSHSDLLHYLLQSVKQDRDLLDLLVEEGKVTLEAAHEAIRRHDFKRQIRQEGRVRLGEILVMRGRVTQDQVLAAVLAQMEHPDAPPLGHLLVDQGLVTPEELAAGLIAQDERIEALVEKELKGGEAAHEQGRAGGFRRPATAGALSAAAAAAAARSQSHKGRRKPSRALIGLIAAALVLAGSVGFIAYKLGPGRVKTPQAEAKPAGLAFMTGGNGTGDLDDAFLTIADVKRSARKPGDKDASAEIENPAHKEEIEDFEQYVEAQQAEIAKMKKVAKIARAVTPLAGSGAGGQITMDDLARMASRMEARAQGARGAGAAGSADDFGNIAGGAVGGPDGGAVGGPASGPEGSAAGGAVGDRSVGRARGPGGIAAGGSDRRAGAGRGDADDSAPGSAGILPTPRANANSSRQLQRGSSVRRPLLTARPKPTKGPAPLDGALNTQALLDIANGSYDAARESLAEAVKLEPDNPVTLFNLALCDYHLKQYDKALAELARARSQLEAGSGNLRRLAGPAIAHRLPLASGSIAASRSALVPAQAPDAIRALIRVTTLLSDTITYQGHTRSAMGQKDLAAKHYKEALPLYRRKAALQTALADLYRADGNLREATAGYSAATQMDPRYAAPWLALGEIARIQKQDALARKYLAIHERLASR